MPPGSSVAAVGGKRLHVMMAAAIRVHDSDSDDEFLESLCRSRQVAGTVPPGSSVAAVSAPLSRSDDSDDHAWLHALCRRGDHDGWPLVDMQQAFDRCRTNLVAPLGSSVAAVSLSSADSSATPRCRSRSRQGDRATQSTELGETWGPGRLSRRECATIADLVALFSDRIRQHSMPIHLHMAVDVPSCDAMLLSVLASSGNELFYVGTTQDVVRRWLGDDDDNKYFTERGVVRTRMPGHCKSYRDMYVITLAPISVARWLEPHLIRLGKQLYGHRSQNLADDRRGQAPCINCIYVCVGNIAT